MNVFLDSSAFAKRYLAERGSETVLECCRQATKLCVSVLCLPEVISALNRLRRQSLLTKRQYEKLKNAVLVDVRDVEVCDLSPRVVARAVRLLEENPLRAMDALHVACALEWKAELFVSSDQQQIAAAQTSGVRVLPV